MALVHRTIDPAQVGYDAGNPDFFDDFNYTVTDDPADATANIAAFTNAGWAGVKAINTGQAGAYGTLHTVSSIPGYAGSHPTEDNMLRLYANGRSGGTDVYLTLGDGNTSDYIPADVWFRFWFFINNTGSELSGIEQRHKFLYPSYDGFPSGSSRWLVSLSANNYQPNNTAPYGDPTDGEAFIVNRDLGSSVDTGDFPNYTPGGTDNYWKLGQTSLSEDLQPNRWQLVTIHMDTSGTSGNIFEAWIQPLGGSETKVCEWIGGTTANFTWGQTVASPGGHSAMKLFTTIGWTDSADNDAYYYMQHFAMASGTNSGGNGESDLPSYN